jgi:hypothetical protein
VLPGSRAVPGCSRGGGSGARNGAPGAEVASDVTSNLDPEAPSHLVSQSAPTNRTISTAQQAFVCGLARLERSGVLVDKFDCRISIQRSKRGWLMTVSRLPPTLSEIIVVIEPNGETSVAPGL